MLINTKFILASSSKSRYKILKQNGLNFTKQKPKANEDLIKKKLKKTKKKPSEIAKLLAEQKAKSISKKNPGKMVLGCDTIIVFNGKIFDKAKNYKQAKKKLEKLSGKEHQIISSAVVFKQGKKIWSATEKTNVKIRKLDKKEINKYLKECGTQILESVGCYQIERLGPNIIESIKGDFFNVMGFPLFSFLKFLMKSK
jgi:MAF protein